MIQFTLAKVLSCERVFRPFEGTYSRVVRVSYREGVTLYLPDWVLKFLRQEVQKVPAKRT